MQKGRKFISDLKFYTDYAKWRPEYKRYERWEESAADVINTHRNFYNLPELEPYLKEAEEAYKEKLVLASQRSLQYRGEQIYKNHARLFNCVGVYMDKPEVLHKSFYLLLSGCGVGVSMLKHWTSKLPKLIQRDTSTIRNYVIEDSIEGWADAAGVLVSSFCEDKASFPEYQGYVIRFDYSKIRPKGSFISGGFKAPGPEGLKQSLERIERMLEKETENGITRFRSIVAYDILMHLSDAVLSGGVRRSACLVIVDPEDYDMTHAKVGNWRETNKQRERSNNSVGLFRGDFYRENFKELVKKNNGLSDLGFVFLNNIFEVVNPCAEITFTPVLDFEKETTAFNFCNLTEINAAECSFDTGRFHLSRFYQACRVAAIIATLQAGYTSFPYLGKNSEDMAKREALIGVSITGWMNRPELFNETILREGTRIVKETNEKLAKIIGINPAARTTTTKPSGNASVLLGCASGIHPEHSKRYFRIMQLNKQSETAKWLEINMPDLLEESQWSATNSDYVVYTPIENSDITFFKDDLKGIDHLEKIRFVQKHWIENGKVQDRCIMPKTQNNVSCTVIIDDYDKIADYLYDRQTEFTAVSFLSDVGDKDYIQAPFTSVLNAQELLEKYGDSVMFASGLIVDGLHYFSENLWDACEHLIDKEKPVSGRREDILLKKDWIRRGKQFAKNYFRNDLEHCIRCLKDVHLFYRWVKVNKALKDVDFEKILRAPNYTDVTSTAAQACSSGACEVTRF